MKKILYALAVTCVLALTPLTVSAQNVQDFTIDSFTADYYLDRDDQGVATFRVVEEIVAEFPDTDQNRGILRALPQTYQDHSLDLDVLSVNDGDGNPRQYRTETDNDNLVLRIGRDDAYVHGEQTYTITYDVRGVASHHDDHDEIYWDVNGTQWQQPFNLVAARIHVPEHLADAYTDNAACYTGAEGASTSNCQVLAGNNADDGLQINVITAERFTAGENLSYVLAFEEGTFEPYQRTPGDQALFYTKLIGGWILPPVIALVVTVRNWYTYGRDPKGKGTIIPRYTPPKDITLLDADVLLNERPEPKAISAQILDLAVRGYIKIYEEKEEKLFKDALDYTLELTKEPTDLRDHEREVVTMLFGTNPHVGATVELNSLKSTLSEKAASLGKAVSRDLAKRNYFRHAPHLAKTPYIVTGVVCLAGGVFLFRFLGGGLLIAGLILLAMSRLMPARTKKGVTTRDHLLGLRDYMQLAEADRIKTMQSPRGDLTEKIDTDDQQQVVKVYERLLPYAMLFGIEKEWAKEFADIYDREPDWYNGAAGFQGAAFASSLSSFNSVSSASFSAPSSSSSSGFGGGGFSGGGGGGGGGGGW